MRGLLSGLLAELFPQWLKPKKTPPRQPGERLRPKTDVAPASGKPVFGRRGQVTPKGGR